MRPFDTVVVVDWSGAGDRGLSPKADAIWAGTVRDGRPERPCYLRSRGEAEDRLSTRIAEEIGRGRRLLVGFDFPFGYPAGAARRIAGHADPRLLWEWIADALGALPDGEGRFHLAARLNGAFPGDGPFWFNGLKGDIEGLPREKPRGASTGVPERRLVERNAPGTFSCWQMGGAGAVGSQALTGMATLARLRRCFPGKLAAWPFEPMDEAPVVLAEVWPSLLADAVAARMSEDDTVPRDGRRAPIKDAVQVAVLSETLARLGAQGRLAPLFAAAFEADPDAVAEEGWILGVGAGANLLLDPEGGPRAERVCT